MTTATQVKTNDSGIRSKAEKGIGKWFGSSKAVKYDQDGIRAIFEKTDIPAYVVRGEDGRIGVADSIGTDDKSDLVTAELLTTLPAYLPEQLGDSSFRETYGLKYNYMTGAMANGIGSAELVIAGSKAGILSSFGAAGMVLHRIEEGIKKIQAAVGDGAYAVNLIHSPAEEALERNAAELFMKMGVTIVETSDRKSTRLNSSHVVISYAVFCLKKKTKQNWQMKPFNYPVRRRILATTSNHSTTVR